MPRRIKEFIYTFQPILCRYHLLDAYQYFRRNSERDLGGTPEHTGDSGTVWVTPESKYLKLYILNNQIED